MYNKINSLLQTYNYFIFKDDWETTTKEHPEFPEITALVEILELHGIDCFLAKVPEELLDDLPETFVTLIYDDGIPFTVILDKTDENNCRITFFDNKIKQFSKEEFIKIWSGLILSIEENTQEYSSTRNPFNYEKLLKKSCLVFTISLFLLVSYTYKVFTFSSFILFIINLMGVFFSFYALKISLGFNNASLNRFCSSIKDGNCNQVITSKKSFILKNVSLSDLSFVFYVSSLITSFLSSYYPGILLLNYTLVPITTLFVGYTIFYQYQVLQKWCLICLSIALITFLQNLVLTINFQLIYNPEEILGAIFIFSMISLIWLYIRDSFQKLSDLRLHKYHVTPVYKDPEVFGHFYEKEEVIQTDDFNSLGLLRLSNNAHKNITFVLSLNCEYCKYEYEKIKKLHYYFENKLGLNLIFSFKPEEISAGTLDMVNRFYELNQDTKLLLNSLDDFLIKRYSEKSWLKKWGSPSSNFDDVFANNISILEKYEILDSPEVLINARRSPKAYKIEDLKYFFKYTFELSPI